MQGVLAIKRDVTRRRTVRRGRVTDICLPVGRERETVRTYFIGVRREVHVASGKTYFVNLR